MRNIRNIILLFIAAAFSYSCSSVNSGDTFLWRIDKGESHIYLLGSIHVGSPDMFPLDQRITSAYDESDEVAFEIDMSKVNPMELMKYMTYSDGTKLKDNISEESYEKLKKSLEASGLPEVAFESFKPWAAAITAQQMIMAKEGFDESNGIDNHFMEKANSTKKPIRELETAEFQMGLFSEFDKVGDSFIDFTLESNDSSTEIQQMVNAWKEGNKEELNNIINGSRDKYPEFEKMFDKIIDERNDNMTAVVEKWLKEGKTIFIVVGAGHLIGEKGIINQLSKKEGYEIQNY